MRTSELMKRVSARGRGPVLVETQKERDDRETEEYFRRMSKEEKSRRMGDWMRSHG